MRQRPAAAGGDAVTRRRRAVCYHDLVGSLSASASGSPTTSEECRRSQASANLFIVIFCPPSSALIIVCSNDAGATKPRNCFKQYAMAAVGAWSYEDRKLEAADALKMLVVGRPREVVDMKQYCLDIPSISRVTVPGAIAQKQKDGSSILQHKNLMAEPAQELGRAALVFLDDLFKTGNCLRVIKDDALKVDTASVTVLLSARARDEDLMRVTSSLDLDNTIACMADKLEEYIFIQNGVTTAELPEEVQDFFRMMTTSGSHKMWWAILNNAALVPLENLREYYLRIFEQLHFVVQRENHNEFAAILEELEFPMDWHNKVSRNLNGILFTLYTGSVYDATAVTKREQANQITTMFRNSGVHVLDKNGFFIGRSDACIIHCSLAPLLYSSLAKALQKRGWLVSSNVHTLFVYTRRQH